MTSYEWKYKSLVTWDPCHVTQINFLIDFDFFFYFDFSANLTGFSIKMLFYALLTQICLTGCSGYPTDVESGPMSKVDAPGVKTSVPMSETDSVSDFYYNLKFFN